MVKWVVIVGDGMADYPCSELNGRTPLEVSFHPNMDSIAEKGCVGLLETIPKGMYPGTDIAHLTILGYDPSKYYTGRAPIEAAGINIYLNEGDTAFRCNLVYVKDNILIDYSACHISDNDAIQLINTLNKEFEDVKFYHCSSYRSIAIFKSRFPAYVKCYEPHDNIGRNIKDLFIKPLSNKSRQFAEYLNNLMIRSYEILSQHPINLRRLKRGLRPANMIWFWGPGLKPRIPSFKSQYGINGAIISEVPLVRGIGVLLGMKVIDVPGLTGYYNTNYDNIAKYAVNALENYDFLLIHIEVPDEASHEGNINEKIKAIENIDRKILGYIMDNKPEDTRIIILTDHYTSVTLRKHIGRPVPFAIEKCKGPHVDKFNERSVISISRRIIKGSEFIKSLLLSKVKFSSVK